MRILSRWSILLLFSAIAVSPISATTDKYRATWREDPSTTMVIGWNQIDGSSPRVYYDIIDHGTNTGGYAFQHSPDRTVSYFGMNNQFARLTGLQPDTLYFFVISDSNSTSSRMMFRTGPADDTPFTVLAGGDSRNNWDVRILANKMAAKLKPLFIMFGGDMTASDNSSEWQAWLDHWQYTITSEGRLLPVVVARGNHELSNTSVENMFDSPHPKIYFALTFGAEMLRTYTLNSEDVEGGNQASWLASDLAANQQVSWRFAQYHKPMRPHVSSKSEGNSEYDAWANLFYEHNMDLVVECDSHVVKSTWPVRPFSGSGSQEGFIRDDANGTIYMGEGTWGAPLRTVNDTKAWTRESGSFNQFKWLNVTRSKVQIKTVQYGNVDSVGEVNENSPYTPPSGLQTWGALIEINASGLPIVNLTSPIGGSSHEEGQTLAIAATASSNGATISKVGFYVDGSLLSEDSTTPYTASWSASGAGFHDITARAYDSQGQTADDSITIQVGSVAGTTELQDGVPATSLAGAQGSWQHFFIDVPANTTSLDVSMSGGTGDADMYVLFGAQPDLNTYTCRPYTTGNENCAMNNPTAGRWFVSLYGYSAYSGVQLLANLQTGGGAQSISVRVSSSTDDAEERASSGAMSLTSTDLELVYDGTRGQLVGIRFQNVAVPAGANITSATIQFTVDEVDSKTTQLVIYGEASGNPATFTSSTGNISARLITTTSVDWQPSAWSSVGQAGSAQKTPNLAVIVQELVNRSDWNPGNSMVFLFDGTGERTAEAYNGSPASAPLLEITWQ